MVIIQKRENQKPMIHIDCMDTMLFGVVFCIIGLLVYSELWFEDFTLRALVCSNLLIVFRSLHRWIGFVSDGIKDAGR